MAVPGVPSTWKQADYEARRRDWREWVRFWLRTRELPGSPPPIRGAEDVLGLERPA